MRDWISSTEVVAGIAEGEFVAADAATGFARLDELDEKVAAAGSTGFIKNQDPRGTAVETVLNRQVQVVASPAHQVFHWQYEYCRMDIHTAPLGLSLRV